MSRDFGQTWSAPISTGLTGVFEAAIEGGAGNTSGRRGDPQPRQAQLHPLDGRRRELGGRSGARGAHHRRGGEHRLARTARLHLGRPGRRAAPRSPQRPGGDSGAWPPRPSRSRTLPRGDRRRDQRRRDLVVGSTLFPHPHEHGRRRHLRPRGQPPGKHSTRTGRARTALPYTTGTSAARKSTSSPSPRPGHRPR